jgi:hypothetical protein
MRRICLALILVGCGGSGDNGSSDAGVVDTVAAADTATEDVAEAADVAVADSTPVDAATVSPDAALAPAWAQVRNSAGVAVAGVSVVFHGSDGRVIAYELTDETGVASAVVSTGSMITVAYVDNGENTLRTVAGVEPGDTIHFTVGYVPVSQAPVGTVTATVPSPAPEGTAAYRFDPRCGGAQSVPASTGSFSRAINESCLDDDGTIDVVIAAGTTSGSTYYAVDEDLLVVAGETTDATFGGWVAASVVDVQITDLPAGQQLNWSMSYAHDSWDRDFLGLSFDPFIDGYDASSTWHLPGDFLDTVRHRIDLRVDDTRRTTADQRFAGVPTSPATFAAADLFLPRMASFTVSATDTVRPEIRWTAESPITNDVADAAEASVYWTGGSWTILHPVDASQPIVLPVLPDDLASYRPPTDLSVHAGSVNLTEADFLDGYDGLRVWNFDEPDAYLIRASSMDLGDD